jgi:hypothetical protein
MNQISILIRNHLPHETSFIVLLIEHMGRYRIKVVLFHDIIGGYQSWTSPKKKNSPVSQKEQRRLEKRTETYHFVQ